MNLNGYDPKKRFSIAQAITCLDRAGSEILGSNIAIRLRKEGYRTFICAINKGGVLEKDLISNNVPYHIFYIKSRPSLSTTIAFYKFLRKNGINVVHTHHLYVLVHCFLGALLAGARIIHTEHDFYSISSRKSRVFLRILSFFCKKITGVSAGITDYMRDKIGIRSGMLCTINNGVDLTSFCDSSSYSKKDLGLKDSEITVGSVGRLEKVKDFGTLLRAFKLSQNTVKNTTLILIGDGSQKDALKNESVSLGISNKTLFLGVRDDIPKLLHALDIFVVSSIMEGLPLSALEAMAAGIPVIATRVGDIPKLITDRHNGLIVPPGDPAGLARAIIELATNAKLYSTLRENAMRMVKDSYDFEDTFRGYEKLYSSSQ